MLVQQQRFQRFRRDLQDTGRVLHELLLMARGDVAVPVPDRNIGFRAKVRQPVKLVVDQCLKGADIDAADRRGRVLGKQGNNREKGCLRLAGGRGRGQQQILVRIENDVRRGNLYRTKVFPMMSINIVLYKRGIPVESVHSVNSANSSPAS